MKIGTQVKIVNCAEAEKYKDRVWKTRSEPWQIGSGEWLVLLEGRAGGFAVRCLEEVTEMREIHDNAARREAEVFSSDVEGFQDALKKVAQEIADKKMVPMGRIIKVLEEIGEYCDRCEADEPTLYYDHTDKTNPAVRCPWCGYSIKLNTLINRARNLPEDFADRMVASPGRETMMEQIGEDTWITNGTLAEIAGDCRYSYPDRDKFKTTDAVGRVLDGLALDEYEEAKLLRTVYRGAGTRGMLIAALQSQHRTVYIDNDFTKHIGGIYTPFIRGPQEPVLVKDSGKICRIILPIRFDPKELGAACADNPAMAQKR